MKALTKKARIIKAIAAAGCDAYDLRDAAHEACHALQVEQPFGYWSREFLHKRLIGLPATARGTVEVAFADGRVYSVTKYRSKKMCVRQVQQLVAYEIEARAVEQIVCKDLKVKTDSIEKWAAIALIEADQGLGITMPSLEWVVERVHKAMATKRARTLADRVIALGEAH